MALGLNPTVANSLLAALLKATPYTGPAALYVKLHIGDPGAAGTTNPAANTTRQQVTFTGTPSGGQLSNNAAVSWTNVSAAEDYSHYSVWDSSTAGAFQFSGLITANAVTVGDTFTVAAGGLVASFAVAA